MLLENPCEGCIIKSVCCNLCDESKNIWENSMTCGSNKYLLEVMFNKHIEDQNTIHWWFERLIKYIEEKKGN